VQYYSCYRATVTTTNTNITATTTNTDAAVAATTTTTTTTTTFATSKNNKCVECNWVMGRKPSVFDMAMSYQNKSNMIIIYAGILLILRTVIGCL